MRSVDRLFLACLVAVVVGGGLGGGGGGSGGGSGGGFGGGSGGGGGGGVAASGARLPPGWKGTVGDRLNGYNETYAALRNGARVRYYLNFTQCALKTGPARSSPGGEVEYFEVFFIPDSAAVLAFTSQDLQLEPAVVSIWSLHELSVDDQMTSHVITLDPKTGTLLDYSVIVCDMSAVYLYTTTPTPPTLLTTYGDIYSTLRSGYVVTYAVDYARCLPSPSTNSTGGGAITLYMDITGSQPDVGFQFTALYLAVGPQPQYSEMNFSLHQNGTVDTVRALLSASFDPVFASFESCLMNDGTNSGAMSFYGLPAGGQ